MAVAEDRFFETRATQLAVVHLTRRADVQVTQEAGIGKGQVIDLLVSLLENGQNVGQLLAVEVKAVMSEKRLQGSGLQWHLGSTERAFRLPLCLFVFSMDTDQGYWRWVQQPSVPGNQKRALVFVEDDILKPLNNAALDEIISSVHDWYSA